MLVEFFNRPVFVYFRALDFANIGIIFDVLFENGERDDCLFWRWACKSEECFLQSRSSIV